MPAQKLFGSEVKYESNKIELLVRDDGVGFNPDTASTDGHFGLTGIKERVHQIKGALRIQSQPETGTELLRFCVFVGAGKNTYYSKCIIPR